jgi:hypothetical protein
MATISERIERLHPEIIQNYFASGNTSGIPENVIKYIEKIDKIPELYRRNSSPSATARELKALYPDLFTSIQTARGLVYAAINHFHLNSTVKNEAWDNLYADRFDELANLEAIRGNIEAAKRIYTEAHRLRTLRNDDKINPDLLQPIIQVISPEATPDILGLDEEYNLKELWVDVKGFVNNRVKGIDDEQRAAILREAGKNLNIDDSDWEDINE